MEEAKTLKTLAWNVDEETYRSDPSYHYSMLARYAKEGFRSLHSLEGKEETNSLKFGSLVDCLVTENENFYKKFFVLDDVKLSDTLKKITQILYNKFFIVFKDINDIDDEKLCTVLNENNIEYYNILSFEKRAEKIKKSCASYYKMLHNAEGKMVVSRDEYDDAVKVCRCLKEHPLFTGYFDILPFDNTETLYQAKFRTEKPYNLKCMFDVIYISHNKKIIYPYDIKTTSRPEYEFPYEFLKWKYYIQSSLYTYILTDNIRKSKEFNDYIIEPFRFIVVNKNSLSPLVFSADIDFSFYRNHEFENWSELVAEIDEYQKNNAELPKGFSYDKPNSLNELLKNIIK